MRFNKMWITALAACALYSCGGSSEKSQNRETNEVAQNVEADDEVEGSVIEIDSEDFADKVADYTTAPYKFVGDKPCIVDFSATWCGPCKALAPVLGQVASTTGVNVLKVDVDKSADVAEAYGIQAIPALLICSGGEVKVYQGDNSLDALTKVAESLK